MSFFESPPFLIFAASWIGGWLFGYWFRGWQARRAFRLAMRKPQYLRIPFRGYDR